MTRPYERSRISDELLKHKNDTMLNLLPNNGSLLAGGSGVSIVDSTDFTSQALQDCIAENNGWSLNASTLSALHQYFSSSYDGGVRAENIGDYTMWLDAFGFPPESEGTHRRSSPNFAVAEAVTGTGTANEYINPNGVSYYQFLSSQLITIQSPSLVSVAFWFQSDSPTYWRGFAEDAAQVLYIDGEAKYQDSAQNNDSYHAVPGGQVTHISWKCDTRIDESNAISSGRFLSYARPSTTIRFAMPVLARGAFQILPHQYPVISAETTTPKIL